MNKLHILYHVLVESLINDGLNWWGGISNRHINNIYIVQNIVIKIILKRPMWQPFYLIFIEFHVLPIEKFQAVQNSNSTTKATINQ